MQVSDGETRCCLVSHYFWRVNISHPSFGKVLIVRVSIIIIIISLKTGMKTDLMNWS